MANSWVGLTPEQRRERGKAYRFNRTNGRSPRRPISVCDVNFEERARVRNAANIFARYGLTPEDEARLFARQSGRCALCHKNLNIGASEHRVRYHIDHDHVTGIVRGLLCAGCNRAGMQGLEKYGEAGIAYVTITPVDLFLRDAARTNKEIFHELS